MAKKSRRQRRKGSATRVAPAPAAQTKKEPSTTETRATSVAKAATAPKVDLAQEYHYVFADLRKIAVIAVLMFAILFALAFVLR
jgi:hypothetical protein